MDDLRLLCGASSSASTMFPVMLARLAANFRFLHREEYFLISSGVVADICASRPDFFLDCGVFSFSLSSSRFRLLERGRTLPSFESRLVVLMRRTSARREFRS